MHLLVRKKTIPEHTTEEKVWVANDGKEFQFESLCRQYEEQLAKERCRVLSTAIKNGYTYEFDDGRAATLYYIRDDEDYQNLVRYVIGSDGMSDYCKYGTGWYMCWCVDGGDYSDDWFLKNLDAYISNHRAAFNRWAKLIQSVVKEPSECPM